MADIIYVTQEGLVKMQEELKNLKEVRRIEIAEKLKEAISFWDLSENSEYEDARNEQAAVEKRIFDLEEDLKNVELIKEDSKDSKDRITMWSLVTIENVATKEQETFKIVGSTESDILAEPHRISNESEIWKSLLWKKKNDTIKVNVPAWKFEYKITQIWDK